MVALVVPKSFPIQDWVASNQLVSKGLIPEKVEVGYLMNLTTQIQNALSDRELETATAEEWALEVEEVRIVR